MPGDSNQMLDQSVSWKDPSWFDQWYDWDPHRLIVERDLMNWIFPQFRLMRNNVGNLIWDGVLTTNLGNSYRIAVEMPQFYPYVEPIAKVLHPSIRASHQFLDGSLCLMNERRNWTTKSSCVVIVGLVAAWLAAYEIHTSKCRRALGGVPCMEDLCPDWPGPKEG